MEIRKVKIDLIIGIILALFSALMIWYIIPREVVPVVTAGTTDIGVTAQTFPIIASAIIGLSAVGMIIASIVKFLILKKKNENEDTKIAWKEELMGLAVFGMCVLYGVLFITVGYIIASIIALPLTLFILGSRDWRHYVGVYATAAVMYVVFRFVLSVIIP